MKLNEMPGVPSELERWNYELRKSHYSEKFLRSLSGMTLLIWVGVVIANPDALKNNFVRVLFPVTVIPITLVLHRATQEKFIPVTEEEFNKLS